MGAFVRNTVFTFLFCTVLFVGTGRAQFVMFQNPMLGEKAPDFTLKLVDGPKTNFTKFRAGKKTILFFWATWCPHCRAQIKAMHGFLDTFKKNGVQVGMVDLGEKEKVVRRFIQKEDIPFPVFLDTEGELEDSYQIIGVPSIFYIDEKGVIRAIKYSLPEDYMKYFETNEN